MSTLTRTDERNAEDVSPLHLILRAIFYRKASKYSPETSHNWDNVFLNLPNCSFIQIICNGACYLKKIIMKTIMSNDMVTDRDLFQNIYSYFVDGSEKMTKAWEVTTARHLLNTSLFIISRPNCTKTAQKLCCRTRMSFGARKDTCPAKRQST